MKLALVHIRQSDSGGTERYLNQVACHLAALGHKVTVVCRSFERSPHPAIQFVVLRNLAAGSAWRMWAFARAVERHVASTGYDIVLGLGRTWTHDVIRLGGGCHRTYLEVAHRRTLRAWERAAGRGFLKQRLTLLIEERALRPKAYLRVITNSEMVRRDVMRRYSIPNERVTVIHNGVDLDRFHPDRHANRGSELRRSCSFGRNHKVVLFLGTGYARKGLGRLLATLPALAEQRPEVRLLVVGYDSSRNDFQRQAARLGVTERVRFLGGRRDAEVCYAAADLYVLPTYYDPFANSTLEALASGLPVVTTDSNGGSELLTQRVSGSVVSAKDQSGALLEELLFWTDGDRAREACQQARELAERYPQENTVRASAEILKEVLAEKHGGAIA